MSMIGSMGMSGMVQSYRYAGMSFRETERGLEVRVKKTKASGNGKKKRLPYSFKQLSQQIANSKTADNARPAALRVRQKLGWLYQKLRSGEYDDEEIAAAILHATSLEKIAKRKLKHLQEEERAEGGTGMEACEEMSDIETQKFPEEISSADISDEMMEELMEQFSELMEEEQEAALQDFSEELSYAASDMTEEEFPTISGCRSFLFRDYRKYMGGDHCYRACDKEKMSWFWEMRDVVVEGLGSHRPLGGSSDCLKQCNLCADGCPHDKRRIRVRELLGGE